MVKPIKKIIYFLFLQLKPNCGRVVRKVQVSRQFLPFNKKRENFKGSTAVVHSSLIFYRRFTPIFLFFILRSSKSQFLCHNVFSKRHISLFPTPLDNCHSVVSSFSVSLTFQFASFPMSSLLEACFGLPVLCKSQKKYKDFYLPFKEK